VSYEVFRGIVWAVGLPIIVWLSVRAVRRIQAIRRRDAELREEEAQSGKDPYARLAELYRDDA
jgi:hypothetical protein